VGEEPIERQPHRLRRLDIAARQRLTQPSPMMGARP
jgi:hypothetical protein